MNVEGGCFCGAVRFKAEGDPILKGFCHCGQCQHVAGGGPNVFMAMPKAGFSYTKGKPKQFSRGQDVPMPVTREFCPECGTPLTTHVGAMPDAVFLKVGALDDKAKYGGPDMAIFMAEKQVYHTIPQGISTFDGMPG